MTLLVVERARVIPAAHSDSVLNSLTIPLTFFDLPWLLFSPVKRVFFYKLTDSTREHFHSIVLPKLKLSLSLVLRHYLPLSGRIIWDQNESKPSIVVSPNDAVSVTIAESEGGFSHLSSYEQRAVSELHKLLPPLPVSDDSASALSLQITLFPNQGLSIGVAALHAVLDGKTSSTFIKAWAHFCKHLLQNENENENHNRISLPESLTPSYDRSSLKYKTELESEIIERLRSLKKDRSLTPIAVAGEPQDDVVLATLVLTVDDIQKLREQVKKTESPRPLHLSTFVIAYAYVWTCLVKARGGDGERSVSFVFVGDFRERLNPPLPATYFGNCMFPMGSYNRKAREFADEKGFVRAVQILSDLVKGLSSQKIETFGKEFVEGFCVMGESSQAGSVAGSNRLGVYESDFGWGRPVKVDVISIGGESISMAESREESGGIEIGLCLKKTEIDIIVEIFNNGLQN